jgi:hypothetical protein
MGAAADCGMEALNRLGVNVIVNTVQETEQLSHRGVHLQPSDPIPAPYPTRPYPTRLNFFLTTLANALTPDIHTSLSLPTFRLLRFYPSHPQSTDFYPHQQV